MYACTVSFGDSKASITDCTHAHAQAYMYNMMVIIFHLHSNMITNMQMIIIIAHEQYDHHHDEEEINNCLIVKFNS
jgi:hypothetical protein